MGFWCMLLCYSMFSSDSAVGRARSIEVKSSSRGEVHRSSNSVRRSPRRAVSRSKHTGVERVGYHSNRSAGGENMRKSSSHREYVYTVRRLIFRPTLEEESINMRKFLRSYPKI